MTFNIAKAVLEGIALGRKLGRQQAAEEIQKMIADKFGAQNE